MMRLLTRALASSILVLHTSGCGFVNNHSDKKKVENAFHDVGYAVGKQEQRIVQLEVRHERAQDEKKQIEVAFRTVGKDLGEQERKIKRLEAEFREQMQEEKRRAERHAREQEERQKDLLAQALRAREEAVRAREEAIRAREEAIRAAQKEDNRQIDKLHPRQEERQPSQGMSPGSEMMQSREEKKAFLHNNYPRLGLRQTGWIPVSKYKNRSIWHTYQLHTFEDGDCWVNVAW